MNIVYPYLPDGKDIKYVGANNEFMLKAKEAARISKEQGQPTGAVAVIGSDIIAIGSNVPPITNKHLIELHKRYCIRRMFNIPSGQKYWMCPGCAGCENHAESLVAKQVIRKGLSNFDLYLYGHWWCCEPCWDNMIKAGVQDVYLLEGSEILFNPKKDGNIIATQFK